jgi:hypothetical protein
MGSIGLTVTELMAVFELEQPAVLMPITEYEVDAVGETTALPDE